MTHQSNEIRSLFEAIIEDDNSAEADLEAAGLRDFDALLDLLEECDDIMPGSLCETLEIPAGSTYAEGVEADRERGSRGY